MQRLFFERINSMKKTSKILISVILCLTVAFCTLIPAFATEPKTAFIVVSGMNTFPLYKDGEKVFPTTAKTIAKLASKIILPLVGFFADGDYDKLGDSLFPAAAEAFDDLACNPDGNSKHDITTDLFPLSAGNYPDSFMNEVKDEGGVVKAGIEAFGEDNTYFFNYDWRLDPLKHADELNKFIKNVKAETKCDRVALAAFSMGGTVTLSYLYKYGSKDVDSVSLCSTAFQGTSCMGSMFSGELSVDAYGLIRRMAQLTRNDFLDELVMLIDNSLEAYKINASIDGYINGILSKLNDRLYKELIIPVFGYMPGLWALVDARNYEESKNFMLAVADSELIKAIDEYHYNVQAKAYDILKAAEKDTNIYITAQYNMQGLPVSDTSTNSNNDFLIDVGYASGGAISSKLGGTLPDSYTQAKADGHNHLSADRQLDASTCMFPDQTWFIRDMAHVDYNVGESTDFLIWLAKSEKQLTVYDSGVYPQFMKYNSKDNTLSPVTDELLKPTAIGRIFDFLTKLIELSAKIIFTIIKAIPCN